jgi:hypothetical protein
VGTNAGADAAVNTGASAIKMVPETAFWILGSMSSSGFPS